MSAPLSDETREIIPRWRDLKATIAAGELTPPQAGSIALPADYLRDKLSDWEREQILPYANEVIGAALVLGRTEEALPAARFVLAHRSGASNAAVMLAERVLSGVPDSASLDRQRRDSLRTAINHGKLITRNHPRSAFAWAELSRNYALLGVIEKAVAAMNVAVALAPNNRYVLRSAARLYTHVRDHERAHQVLRASGATYNDPWLMAAELSTASLAGKPPKHVKSARQLLDTQKYSAFELAELASALGTLDARAADLRRARKLFRISLNQPNENVVAQARWAATHDIIDLDPEALHIPGTYEARAWQDFYNGQWSSALRASNNWFEDQPFSASPAIHSSYIAAVALQDHAEVLRITEKGLLANPNNPTLLNNRAYSLVNLNRLNEAERVLDHIARSSARADLGRIKPVLLATAGLLCFRRGELVRGRELYTAAIQTAERSSNRTLAAKAAVFFALEEIRSGVHNEQVLQQAIRLSAEFSDSDFMLLRKRLDESLKRQAGSTRNSRR